MLPAFYSQLSFQLRHLSNVRAKSLAPLFLTV